MSIPNAVNNVQNMLMSNGQSIEAHTNILTFTIFLANARSIVNKMSELEEYVFEYYPDVIMISESWAHDSISDVELNLKGFNLLRSDRLFSKGGGCMLYVKELYIAIVVDDLTNVPNSESVWCKLTSNKSSLVIGVCYHGTSPSVIKEFALHNFIYFIIYFSHRTIYWDLLQCDSEGPKKFHLTLYCFLHQHVNEPTRGENTFDLVLSSCKSMVGNLVMHEKFANSDRNFIIFDLFCDVSMTYWKELYLDLRRGNFDAMKNELGLIDWLEMSLNKNADEIWLFEQKKTLNEIFYFF